MKVIAIDPSMNNVGWAIADKGNLIRSGLIKTKGKTHGEKLFYLGEHLYEITKDANLGKAYIDKTIYKGRNKSIQTIFVFAKSIGFLEYFFQEQRIPLYYTSPKLARKQIAINRVWGMYHEVRTRDKVLTTHEAEAIIGAAFHSREIGQ